MPADLSAAPHRPPADGLLANDKHLAAASIHQVLDGPAAGTRVLLVQPAGGIHCRVLLDRGMDIGAAWFVGLPLSWTSPSGERRAGYADAGEGWHRGWAGGLLTTCGLRHIGAPADGHGRHGTYSDCPAEDVSVRSRPTSTVDGSGADGGTVIEASGTVRETGGLDRGLVLRRHLTWFLWSGRLQVDDQVTNETNESVTAPILYHLNFGYPFLTPDTKTTVHGTPVHETPVPGDTGGGTVHSSRMGPPAAGPDEVVGYRLGAGRHDPVVTIRSPHTNLRVELSGLSDSLDRVYTWRRREPGCYVEAVEPANADLVDPDRRRWPRLEPGSCRQTGFTLVAASDPNVGVS